MKATVLYTAGEPTVVEELTLRPLGAREVRVRISASGVCHTDLSMRTGALPALFPSALGHEGAGVVAEVGDQVTRVQPGDHVVLTWSVPCRTCASCMRGEAHLCIRGLEHGFGAPYAEGPNGPVFPALGTATLAEESLLPETAVVPIDPALPLDLAALLGCGVATGVGAALRTAPVRAGETVLVIGCGGVGLSVIQGARLAGASQIIAADVVASQLETARASGATDTVDVSGTDLVAAVRELTGGVGVDHAIEVVGKPATIRGAYDAARRGGTVTVVGAGNFADNVEFPVLSLMAEGKTIRGSVYGSTDPDRDIPMLADLALRGRLDLEALVTRRIGLMDVEDAFTRMSAGDGARSVVVFDEVAG